MRDHMPNFARNANIRQKVSSTDQYTRQIKIILPEGLRYGLSMDIGTPALLEVSKKTSHLYRTKVRHMAGQMPGQFFSKYQRVQFYASGLVSMKEFSIIQNKTLGQMDEQSRKKF